MRRSSSALEAPRGPGRSPCLGFLLAIFLLAASVGASDLRLQLEKEIAAARRIGRAMGVHVAVVESGEEIASYEPDRLRIAASNTKLATTAAALDALGPGYFFETRVVSVGMVVKGTLRGDLAVIGGGDPNLSGRHYLGDPYGPFRDLAEQLKEKGIHEVTGDLLLIDGLFEGPLVHPDWPKDQLDRWYEAPVSALSFSDNCVLVKVLPGARAGADARLELLPRLPIFRVDQKVATTSSRRKHSVSIGRQGDRLVLRGRIYRGSSGVEKWVPVPDPAAYFGAAIRAAFAEEGIEIRGRTLPSHELPNAFWRQQASHSTDLLTTLEVTNKRSQNFFAESLLKLLGAEVCGEGSWEAGVRFVGGFLEGLGIPSSSFSMADGSGMSRKNLFTPRALTSLLRAMYTHRWGREFMLTLPYSGEIGLKWEDRLQEAPYYGNVFAKTGTLNGVSTLSGYARGRSGVLYVFSILGNETLANWKFQNAQDAILRALIDHG